MIKDKVIIQKKLHHPNLTQAKLDTLKAQVQRSKAVLEQRKKNTPTCTINTDLPIANKQEEITKLLQQHQIIIVCGETGSGKTTQLPQMCLQAGLGVKGKIAHTQPRRLAARTVAARIAEEMKQEIGQAVGYKIRFHDKTNNLSYIKLMTDGILLNEIHSDPLLLQYDTIIIDEAHERSLNIDFLLGYLKTLVRKRPDIKIIITSATIDPDSFAKHFQGAPILFVEGRTYPVEIYYRDYDEETTDGHSIQHNIHQAIDECFATGDGDILIFLATEKDIHETKKYLSKVFENNQRLEVLPLFSRLSQKEQNLIFHPKGKKRIVLATNVAETSVTVPGIDFVIDTGKARVSRYCVRSKIQRLPIEDISQASAKQRAGRCGRLRPGTVFRLYSQTNFDGRDEFTQAEILRTNLASVILQMKALNLGEIEHFPFINPPESRQINDGYRLLYELSAFDKNKKIKPIGKQLARFPVDPQCARMLIAASQSDCLAELLVIVSAISVQDPKERPHNHKQAADTAHKVFQHKTSDFLSYINLYQNAKSNQKALTQNKYRKWCKQNFVSYQRMQEWFDIHRQLKSTCQQLKLSINQKDSNYENIHQAILSGIASHIAIKDEKFDYLGTRNRKMHIFPGSALFKKPPKTIVALEIAETSSVFARTVAKIELSWVEPWVQHLISKSYGQPSWKQKPGLVSAIQTSNLYGLNISANKRVNYCTIDPDLSRELFIRHAMVYGEWHTRAKFLSHNLQLIDTLLNKEHKARRKDILVNDEWLEHFYSNLLPPHICSGAMFEKWAKQLPNKEQQALFLTQEQLIQNDVNANFDDQYPSVFSFNGIELPLSYHFQPGNPQDGVVLTVPIELLPQVPEALTQWLVPGFIEEKCINILKGLPKHLRKQIVPIPNYVKVFLASTPCLNTGLYSQLVQYLKSQNNISISTEELQTNVLEPFYLMGFQITDEHGKNTHFSKDLASLKTSYQKETPIKTNKKILNQQNIEKWDFGDLQESFTEQRKTYKVNVFPALQLIGNNLQINTFNDLSKAHNSHLFGLVELIKRQLKQEIKYIQRNLIEIKNTCLRLSNTQDCQTLKEDIIDNAIYQHFLSDKPLPRKQTDFESIIKTNSNTFQNYINLYCETLNKVLNQRQIALKPINKNIPLGWIETITDIKDQDTHLVFKGFITQLSLGQLKNYLRYYKAITIRLESLKHNPEKDRTYRVECLPTWERYKKLIENKNMSEAQTAIIKKVRWKIEELRISLFAQQIKTTEKISVKRIEKLFETYKNI